MDNTQDNGDIGFLFSVDILIKNQSNAKALQLLIEMMNQSDDVLDFRVKSGIKLGGIIDTLLELKKKPHSTQSNISNSTASKYKKIGNSEKASTVIRKVEPIIQQPIVNPTDSKLNNIEDPKIWIRACIKDNRLVHLTANRLGKVMTLPCRILNLDEEKQFINVYHVDEKQVYSFNLNEIDSFDH
ncbi:hypothetical protein [Paenibacillus sp. CMAA1364]